MRPYQWRRTHVYRWSTTALGALHPKLAGRKGETCRIFARASRSRSRADRSLWYGFPPYGNGAGSLGIEFEDGARFIVPFYAVKALPITARPEGDS